MIPEGNLKPKMWRGNSVSCRREWRLVLLMPGSGEEFPSAGTDWYSSARAAGNRHTLPGKGAKKTHRPSLFLSVFNKSFVTLSSHMTSVRTGEQLFYMYLKLHSFHKDGSSYPSQQEPQMLIQHTIVF